MCFTKSPVSVGPLDSLSSPVPAECELTPSCLMWDKEGRLETDSGRKTVAMITSCSSSSTVFFFKEKINKSGNSFSSSGLFKGPLSSFPSSCLLSSSLAILPPSSDSSGGWLGSNPISSAVHRSWDLLWTLRVCATKPLGTFLCCFCVAFQC